jgi:DNA-binding beta-propeller fold protein YncE
MTSRFFVASVRGHKVVAVGTDGVPHDFASTGALGALAVATDVKRRRLWVTSAAFPQAGPIAPADKGRAVVESFDLDTGKSLTRHTMSPVRGGHMPGDICVAPEGVVYISDSNTNVIYRLSFGLVLTDWVTDPGFRSLQGQAITGDGNTMFVADYSHGIAAIDLPMREVHWLYPLPGINVLGIDGMALGAGQLIAVQNGITPPRIIKLGLGNSAPGGPITSVVKFEVLDRNVPLADEPTMGVLLKDNFVYVANSQWEKYDDDGVRKPGTVLTPPRLISVPIKPKKKK